MSTEINEKKIERRSTLLKNRILSDNTRPSPSPSFGDKVEKAILTLETRSNRITVYSSDQSLLYTVSTEGGAVLAEKLTEKDLKSRFPELYDIVTGTAWAGVERRP